MGWRQLLREAGGGADDPGEYAEVEEERGGVEGGVVEGVEGGVGVVEARGSSERARENGRDEGRGLQIYLFISAPVAATHAHFGTAQQHEQPSSQASKQAS